jgi:hypothetical protein
MISSLKPVRGLSPANSFALQSSSLAVQFLYPVVVSGSGYSLGGGCGPFVSSADVALALVLLFCFMLGSIFFCGDESFSLWILCFAATFGGWFLCGRPSFLVCFLGGGFPSSSKDLGLFLKIQVRSGLYAYPLLCGFDCIFSGDNFQIFYSWSLEFWIFNFLGNFIFHI